MVRVFISWSGDLSKRLADAIHQWIPSTLQFVKPYYTPSDIDKGTRWANEISKELSSSKVCIIVLTHDNLASPWIMFEAGAISSAIEPSRVCPIVFDIEPTDIQGPLAQFQATRFIKEDMRRLFNTINAAAGDDKLLDQIAETVFEKWWPDLEAEIATILKHAATLKKPEAVRSERELIEEILLLVRNMQGMKEQVSGIIAALYAVTRTAPLPTPGEKYGLPETGAVTLKSNPFKRSAAIPVDTPAESPMAQAMRDLEKP